MQHPSGCAEAAQALCAPPGRAVLELATRGRREAERELREHAQNSRVTVPGRGLRWEQSKRVWGR